MPHNTTLVRSLAALVLSVSIFASCADDPPSKPTSDMGVDQAGETLTVELRPRGQTSAFDPGQNIELISGIQGGYHIEVDLFVDELPEEPNGIARCRLRDPASGQRFGGVTAEIFGQSWQSLDGGASYMLPPIVTDGFQYPDAMLDQTFQFEFSLTLDDGSTHSETLELRLVDTVDELGS